LQKGAEGSLINIFGGLLADGVGIGTDIAGELLCDGNDFRLDGAGGRA
jgi:hypothetical protein